MAGRVNRREDKCRDDGCDCRGTETGTGQLCMSVIGLGPFQS